MYETCTCMPFFEKHLCNQQITKTEIHNFVLQMMIFKEWYICMNVIHGFIDWYFIYGTMFGYINWPQTMIPFFENIIWNANIQDHFTLYPRIGYQLMNLCIKLVYVFHSLKNTD